LHERRGIALGEDDVDASVRAASRELRAIATSTEGLSDEQLEVLPRQTANVVD